MPSRLLATVAVVAVGVIGVHAAVAARAKPALRVAETEPLTVAGVRFRPNERVRVTVVSSDQEAAKTVRARRDGRFTVVFEPVTVDRCNGGLSIGARGALGSRATLKIPELGCPPALRVP